MTEFKTEIEKIIWLYILAFAQGRNVIGVANTEERERFDTVTSDILQLFNKHIEDKKYSIITEVCNYQSDRLTTGLEPIETAQDIISILKIKE